MRMKSYHALETELVNRGKEIRKLKESMDKAHREAAVINLKHEEAIGALAYLRKEYDKMRVKYHYAVGKPKPNKITFVDAILKREGALNRPSQQIEEL